MVQDFGIDPGEHPTDGRFRRPWAEHTEPGQRLRRLVGDPLADHYERAGTGQHRSQPEHQQHRQWVENTARVPRAGHRGEQGQQLDSAVSFGAGHRRR